MPSVHTTLTSHRRLSFRAALLASIFFASGGIALAKDSDDGGGPDASRVRAYIAQRVGGLSKLTVPATDADIPVPTPSAGHNPDRYVTTEAKRYLGKMLFHDPIRTARIDPTYGGVPQTAQTGSCGSCHLGEVSGKAGQQLNFNVGGEGRGYTDARGDFIVRRRPRTDLLIQQRQTQLFPGDALVDVLPTLTDVDLVPPCSPGTVLVTTPARAHKTPDICGVAMTGRLDPLDSVGRESPSMVGFAFNNRLLFGGFAGELNSAPGGLNPNNDPAQENLTLLLTDAHRMFTDNPPLPGEAPGFNGESLPLQANRAFVKLFRDAFPTEAAQADAAGDINLLVNDDTAIRAASTFLRTVVTRNTPFDRYLAGDNRALTGRQLQGATLFFTPAAGGGVKGAGCFSCHSGPMLNKQYNDPDVAGIGEFVEENFINVGIGDHPLQALNRQATGNPNTHDLGRGEITQKSTDAFKFRSLTLRQLKNNGTFFHDGAPRFAKVRDVVEYFNAGVPEDPVAGAAPTLDARFTNPRGPNYPRGLGLTEGQVDALTDFIENGLYDPAFVHYDPTSPTRLFELDPTDVAYSKYRPDLAALGAVDGLVISKRAMNNNDPLTRRDEGFEFLDVTSRLRVDGPRFGGNNRNVVLRLTNIATPKVTAPGVIDSGSVIDTHLLIVVKELPPSIRLINASGTTRQGDPYVRVFLPNGVLEAGESMTQSLEFEGRTDGRQLSYTLDFLSGQGNP